MKHFITTVLSDQRLFKILDDHRVPDPWMKGIFDRKLQPIVASLGSTPTDEAGPPAWAQSLPGPGRTIPWTDWRRMSRRGERRFSSRIAIQAPRTGRPWLKSRSPS